MTNKQATIFILDIGRSMGGDICCIGASNLDSLLPPHPSEPLATHGPVHKQRKINMARTVLLRLIQAKLMDGKKTDQVGIVLAGSTVTRNELAEAAGDRASSSYRNIEVLF